MIQADDRSERRDTAASGSQGSEPDACRIVLTFDDGPHAEFTPRILDVLGRAGVRAAFFVVGSRLLPRREASIVEEAFRSGHVIGNHSFTHTDLTRLSLRRIREEVLRTEARVKDYLGRPKLFRPPYGALNASVNQAVRDLGYRTLLWDVDSGDWRRERTSRSWIDRTVDCARRAISRGRYISILCHDTKPQTAHCLSELIGRLRCIRNVSLEADLPLLFQDVWKSPDDRD